MSAIFGASLRFLAEIKHRSTSQPIDPAPFCFRAQNAPICTPGVLIGIEPTSAQIGGYLLCDEMAAGHGRCFSAAERARRACEARPGARLVT
jgi:hypothetical protein